MFGLRQHCEMLHNMVEVFSYLTKSRNQKLTRKIQMLPTSGIIVFEFIGSVVIGSFLLQGEAPIHFFLP
mgnify:CR=1 FL=1